MSGREEEEAEGEMGDGREGDLSDGEFYILGMPRPRS